MALAQRLAAVWAYSDWVSGPDVPLERLHQLRIAAKGLRYTLEFFQEVLGPEAKIVIEEVKGLQDHLGDLQDAVVASGLLRDFLTWGTWGHAAAKRKKSPPPAGHVIAPGVATYLAARQSELRSLLDGFTPVWVRLYNPETSQLVASSLSPLYVTNSWVATQSQKGEMMAVSNQSPAPPARAASSRRLAGEGAQPGRASPQPKYIILLGAPASGKGTQATQLREALNLPHIASGDLFRENLKHQTELGTQAKAYMDRGELVPDDVTIAMVIDRLSRPDAAQGAILDGFPRTIAQAEALDRALAAKGHRVNAVLNIEVPEDVLVERVSGRWLCRVCGESYHMQFNPPKQPGVCDVEGGELYQRQDDKPETVRKRLQVYREQTSPLIDYYRQQGVLVEINGDQPIEDVQADLRRAVAGL
jgi:adenylate kinase